ncbi:hypothetical protein H072_10864 [Dactylellina haptotyla CBS 200.50]|uniref:MHYT domain-containing protein n=1 Tax=Dactylellina haptotyla (strain CBS 200.50) TaxID=1284197 RepID=S7ZZ67_DACHA|nr:hypothetical protein H072_10864 [Dactylellina haptotyla CBS 200.50]
MERPTLLPGDIAHQEIQAQYVALSYAVSYIGSVTTLELLHRRTGSRGCYNWSLLVGSAISMGSIAIWGMHFIGNRAIILDYGIESHQLMYSSSFTALSFFLPIIVLLSAYMFIGTNEEVSKTRVSIGGTTAGLAVVLMHYLGQFGISNYTSVYRIGFIVGSVIIAIVASNVALLIFFVSRAKWAGTWWKRIGCGFVLAGAVSGMHWLATVGTDYRLRNAVLPKSTLDRKQTVIVVGTLCVFTCTCLLAYAIILGAKTRYMINKVRKVTLSAVMFDPEGRLMVSTSGALPTEVITDTLNSVLDQEFNKEHPVFLWFYRVSRSWNSVKDFVSGMQQHLRTVDMRKLGTEDQSALNLVFREMLCVAAKKLSEQLRQPLDQLGFLYDEILHTNNNSRNRANTSSGSDVEKLRKVSSGKGQTLFVYRQVTREEAARLQSHGYRFTSTKVTLDVVARSLQLHREELMEHLRCIREASMSESILEPGIHLGCFAARANIEGGFDVLVQNLQPNLIPSVQLPAQTLTDEMKTVFQSLDGFTMTDVLRSLGIKLSICTPEEQPFLEDLRSTVRALTKAYPDTFWNDAIFSSHSVSMPCRSGTLDVESSTALMYIFRIVVPIHQRELSDGIRIAPFEFFNMQQRTFSTSRDHEVLARQIHTEFSGFTERVRSPKPALLSPRLKSFMWPISNRPNSSEKALVDNPFANIMISQAVDVHSAKTSMDAHELDTFRHNLAAVAVREIEEPTWAEEYFHLLMSKPRSP